MEHRRTGASRRVAERVWRATVPTREERRESSGEQYAQEQLQRRTQELGRRLAVQTARRTATGIRRRVAESKLAAQVTKATVAGTKWLLMAGGGIATVLIAFLVPVGLLASSGFGIFLSAEDNEGIVTVVRAITDECNEEIGRIQQEVPHDTMCITGQVADWREVLAVYAVKVSSDAVNPTEVVSMSDEKEQMIRTIFWEMTTIAYEVEEVPNEGTCLRITMTNRTAEEMAEHYGFSAWQREQMEELLIRENNELWRNVGCPLNETIPNLV